MTVKELEQRVMALEQQVKRLQAERSSSNGERPFDWQAWVEKYQNDEHLIASLKEGMKLREKERREVRTRLARSRRSKT